MKPDRFEDGPAQTEAKRHPDAHKAAINVVAFPTTRSDALALVTADYGMPSLSIDDRPATIRFWKGLPRVGLPMDPPDAPGA